MNRRRFLLLGTTTTTAALVGCTSHLPGVGSADPAIEAPDHALANDEYTVTVHLTNTESEPVTRTVELHADGLEDYQTVTIRPREAEPVDLTHVLGDADEHEYTIRLTEDDDILYEETFTVTTHATPEAAAQTNADTLTTYSATVRITSDVAYTDDLGTSYYSYNLTRDLNYDAGNEELHLRETTEDDDWYGDREKDIWYIDGTRYTRLLRHGDDEPNYSARDTDFDDLDDELPPHPADLLQTLREVGDFEDGKYAATLDGHSDRRPILEAFDIENEYTNDDETDTDELTLDAAIENNHLASVKLRLDVSYTTELDEHIRATHIHTLEYGNYDQPVYTRVPDDVRENTD